MSDFIYLDKETIIDLNYKTINTHGGTFSPPDNVNNNESLEYLIETIKNDDYYPSLFDKAALYAFNISTRHIFYDGNKRTSILSAFLFMKYNFFKLKDTVSNQDIIHISLQLAKGEIEQESLILWFKENFEEDSIS